MKGPWLAPLWLAAALAAEDFRPPRFESGVVPTLPAEAVGGGQVLLEVSVSASGSVAAVRTLRSTPPFTEALREAVAGWTFMPATERGRSLQSTVLVAGVFRPPTLLGAAPGEVPRDQGTPSESVAFPTSMVVPPYPPMALGDGVVLLEVEVGTDGTVGGAKVIHSASAFDRASQETAREWRFRPSRRGSEALPSTVYLVFGFRQPVTPSPPPE